MPDISMLLHIYVWWNQYNHMSNLEWILVSKANAATIRNTIANLRQSYFTGEPE